MKMQARKRDVETRPHRDLIGRITGYDFEPGIVLTFTMSDRQIVKCQSTKIVETASRFIEHAIEQRIYQLKQEGHEMGKHVDLTSRTDMTTRPNYLHRAVLGKPRPAHKAQPTLLTAEIDREVFDNNHPIGENWSMWTPGEVPPDVQPSPQWHDVWAGDPDTDKAWAHNVD